MDTEYLLNTVGYAGKLLIESGAEIYRVEETMVRLCTSFEGVKDAESFVTPTGLMFSINVHGKTSTKIMRVHSRGVDLHCIDCINALSRQAAQTAFTIEELEKTLQAIAQEPRYPFSVTLFFSALSAGGFAIFFGGTMVEALFAFLIGLLIKWVSWLLERRDLNQFFTNAVAAGVVAVFALLFKYLWPTTDMDIVIISSIMLLVPGLAITNAIRDTVAGDYLSGVSRGVEAFLVAIAIAAGIGLVLSVSLSIGGV